MNNLTIKHIRVSEKVVFGFVLTASTVGQFHYFDNLFLKKIAFF